jgi:PAS domain S-box-containing protein
MVDVRATGAARVVSPSEKPGERRPPSLRTHLIGLVLAAVLPALAIGGAAAWHLADSYRTAFEDRLHDTARALALYLDGEMASRISSVASMAASPLLQRDDLAAFHSWARETAEALDGWVVVNDAAPAHQQVLNTALPLGAPMPSPSLPGAGAWDVIRRAVETGRPAMSDLFVGRALGRPVVAAAAPAMQDGRITRVVVLVMDPRRLAEQLREHAPSGGAYVSVADGAGRIVARSRDQERYVGTTPPSRSVPAAERARRVFTARSVYGDATLFSAQPLRAAEGWSVVVGELYARYRATWLGPLAVLAATAVGALGLGLLIATGLARRILRPVTSLVHRADATAAGDVAPPATPPAPVAEFEALRKASDRAEAALAAREAEYRAIFETVAAGVCEVDAASRRYRRVNRRFCEIVGRSEAELLERLGPEDLCRPLDRGHVPVLHALDRGEESEGEYGLQRPDGTVVWVRSNSAVLARDAQGRPTRAVSVLQDITEKRRAEEERELLAHEVNHRAKNLLAVVQSMLALTRLDSPAAAAALKARVAALGRVHSLLAEEGWAGVELSDLASRELAGFADQSISISGPAVHLRAQAVQPFAMVLHELATNAVKYGALSRSDGEVDLSWSVSNSPDDVLTLQWIERGGPVLTGPPGRGGFGTRVVDSTVRGVGGEVSRQWRDSGLVCRIVVPLVRIAVVPYGRQAATAGLIQTS